MSDDQTDLLRQESENIGAKINEAYEKLATKLRRKADKARASVETKNEGPKRALLRRRFELYASAADYLEMHLSDRQLSRASDSD